MRSIRSKNGFTLIEVIAVLLLSAVITLFASMLLVTSTQIYLTGITAAEDSQKLQVAMNRLAAELTWARAGTIDTSAGTSVGWTSYHPDRFPAGAQTASWNGTPGSPLLLQGIPLFDAVGTFSVTSGSAAEHVQISLSSARSPGILFTTRVYPRYEE